MEVRAASGADLGSCEKGDLLPTCLLLEAERQPSRVLRSLPVRCTSVALRAANTPLATARVVFPLGSPREGQETQEALKGWLIPSERSPWVSSLESVPMPIPPFDNRQSGDNPGFECELTRTGFAACAAFSPPWSCSRRAAPLRRRARPTPRNLPPRQATPARRQRTRQYPTWPHRPTQAPRMPARRARAMQEPAEACRTQAPRMPARRAQALQEPTGACQTRAP
jgi:hypothetical protein